MFSNLIPHSTPHSQFDAQITMEPQETVDANVLALHELHPVVLESRRLDARIRDLRTQIRQLTKPAQTSATTLAALKTELSNLKREQSEKHAELSNIQNQMKNLTQARHQKQRALARDVKRIAMPIRDELAAKEQQTSLHPRSVLAGTSIAPEIERGADTIAQIRQALHEKLYGAIDKANLRMASNDPIEKLIVGIMPNAQLKPESVSTFESRMLKVLTPSTQSLEKRATLLQISPDEVRLKTLLLSLRAVNDVFPITKHLDASHQSKRFIFQLDALPDCAVYSIALCSHASFNPEHDGNQESVRELLLQNKVRQPGRKLISSFHTPSQFCQEQIVHLLKQINMTVEDMDPRKIAPHQRIAMDARLNLLRTIQAELGHSEDSPLRLEEMGKAWFTLCQREVDKAQLLPQLSIREWTDEFNRRAEQACNDFAHEKVNSYCQSLRELLNFQSIRDIDQTFQELKNHNQRMEELKPDLERGYVQLDQLKEQLYAAEHAIQTSALSQTELETQLKNTVVQLHNLSNKTFNQPQGPLTKVLTPQAKRLLFDRHLEVSDEFLKTHAASAGAAAKYFGLDHALQSLQAICQHIGQPGFAAPDTLEVTDELLVHNEPVGRGYAATSQHGTEQRVALASCFSAQRANPQSTWTVTHLYPKLSR